MILTAIHGFCMALADSVPGVSGGTIAFILGFMIASSTRCTACLERTRTRENRRSSIF